MTQNYVVTRQNFMSHYTGTLFDLTNVASVFFLACLTYKKQKHLKMKLMHLLDVASVCKLKRNISSIFLQQYGKQKPPSNCNTLN